MGIRIETPPGLKGTPEQQLSQMYAFLFRLSENLNVALNNLTQENYTAASQIAASGVASSGHGSSIDPNLATSYNELRALINNTATVVRHEITTLENGLKDKYVATSEWGTFQESFVSTVQNEAKAVVNGYGYDSRLTALDEEAAGFSEYQISTEGYIREGFIDYDDNGVPIIGIAIGQGLTSTKVTIGDKELVQIDKDQNCAFYTAEKVSFRVNGVEAAYFSNQKLIVHGIEIGNALSIGEPGKQWEITAHNGIFKIKWIGG